MSSSDDALMMDCPHATEPRVLWDLFVPEECRRDGEGRPSLWVPRLDVWTLDTLRMVIHEMASWLPSDENAEVTIKARQKRVGGKSPADGSQRYKFNRDSVEFHVSSRGWTAWCWTHRNDATDKDGKMIAVWDTGSWSEPMQAVLLDLAAKSPIPLNSIRVVEASDAYTTRRGALRQGPAKKILTLKQTIDAALTRNLRRERDRDDLD